MYEKKQLALENQKCILYYGAPYGLQNTVMNFQTSSWWHRICWCVYLMDVSKYSATWY